MSILDLKEKLFNIDLIINFDPNVMLLGKVESLQIFESSSTIFKKDGLFSTSIFGEIGHDLRNTRLGYIDLKLNILHPLVYERLIRTKQLYEEVMSGKAYVKFDNTIKDLVLSKKEDGGQTGYNYFISILEKIQFDKKDSDAREYNIKLIEKYGRKDKMLNKWLVMPAGLRDYTVSEDGKQVEDEVNKLYRKLLATTNMVTNINITEDNLPMFDSIRYKLQKTTLELYLYIANLLDGKNKFIQGKWAKRAIMYGTRNVITPFIDNITSLNKDNPVTINHTILGLYQYVKAIEPITINKLKAKYINYIFNDQTTKVSLVNPKTMRFEVYDIDIKTRDNWLSIEGIVTLTNKLKLDDMINHAIEVEDKYLFLVYDNKDEIKVLLTNEDIDLVDDKSKIRPITYGELFYITIEDVVDKYPGYLTRYPVTGLGSIYPSWCYVKTTIKGREVKFTDRLTNKVLKEYPILDLKWVRSLSPNVTKLKGLGADFDGDCVLAHVVVRKNKNFGSNKPLIKTSKEIKMPINCKKVVWNYGLINLKEFPKGKLIKTDNNVEYYSVPDDIEVLTVWNGEEKWVKPESYSIHKNLNMLSVRTYRGNSIECSDDHSIVSVDEDLNYIRTNPKSGMCVPRLKDPINRHNKRMKYKKTIMSNGINFNLNFDFGYLLGVFIGDGWVNKETKPNDLMLASIHTGIRDKITEILKSYGHSGNVYSISNTHKFDGFDCFSTKNTWSFRPVADIIREHVGLGAYNKQLPDWWVNTYPGFRWGLLSGLMDTDGSVAKYNNGNVVLNYSTVSSKLAYGVNGLINSLGLTSGMTIHKRTHKETLEYTVRFSGLDYGILKKKLKLYNLIKKEKLDSIIEKNTKDNYTFTPNLPLERLEELQWLTRYHDRNVVDRITKAIRDAKISGIGAPINLTTAKLLFDSLLDLFKNNQFWAKFKSMAEDPNIEWDVIKSVDPIPHITEAYDLTVPPFNTFVIQNGIVVYDTCSFNIIFTEESIKEIRDKLNDINFYLNPDNSMQASTSNDVSELVVSHMTE